MLSKNIDLSYKRLRIGDNMSVKIGAYSDVLKRRFEMEAERLRGVLGSNFKIEHVGSSAVGIGGKNIVDILIGAKNEDGMQVARDLIGDIGYKEGHDTHPDRIFMAFRIDNDDGRETKEGDFHVHICVENSDTYLDFLRLKKYLMKNREVALEYERKKKDFASKAKNDRKKYKLIKSKYVSKLIKEDRSLN